MPFLNLNLLDFLSSGPGWLGLAERGTRRAFCCVPEAAALQRYGVEANGLLIAGSRCFRGVEVESGAWSLCIFADLEQRFNTVVNPFLPRAAF